MSGYDVVGCSECSFLWVIETEKRQRDAATLCPSCQTKHHGKNLRALDHHDKLDGANELRSRRLASRWECVEEYSTVIDNFGTYDAQHEETDRMLERYESTCDRADDSSFTEKFESLVDWSMERHRSKFEQWADEASGWYHDAFADEVSLERAEDEWFDEQVRPELEEWADGPDREDLPRGEVTPTDNAPVNAAVVLDLEDDTVTDVWETLFESDAIRQTLTNSVAELFGGLGTLECYDLLEEYGVPYWLRSPLVDIARASHGEAVRVGGTGDPRRFVDEQVAPIFDPSVSTVDDALTAATLFDGVDQDVTVGVVVRDEWLTDRRRDQRVDVCDLLAVLAANLDVRIVGTGRTLSKVANSHRANLPGVSEWRTRQRDGPRFDDDAKAVAADLEQGTFAVTMLRELYNDESGVLSYAELYALYPGDNDSRVRQLVTEFETEGVVERFGPRTDRKVELHPFGERVLECFEEQTARQKRLSAFVKNFGKQHQQGREPPGQDWVEGEAPGEDGVEGGRTYSTRYLDPAGHAAAAGSGREGALTMVRGAIDDHREKTHHVSYDEQRDEGVVAVRAGEPLPLKVSVAVALASPQFVDQALPPTRLEEIDDPPEIVRNARCIGGASDDALSDGEVFRTKLVEWGRAIESMTTRLNHDEYDCDRNQYRSAIIRSAEGLWGTIAHICEALGITIHREIRIPDGMKTDRLEDFAYSIAHTVAVQSIYNYRACYRQLFEDRPEKRKWAFGVEVDADDPMGSLIGSFVLRGPDVHRLEAPLRDALENPSAVHEDAPEFGIEIPVRSEPTREDVAETMDRILSSKRIATTDAAVSTVHTLAATPHDAARALHYGLAGEDQPRAIRSDELRSALSRLRASRLLPEIPGSERRTLSAGKILEALLEADTLLSQAELIEQTGLCRKTVEAYLEKLGALGLITGDDENGYRIPLAFTAEEAREETVWPPFAADGARFTDAVDALLVAALPPDRYGDPSDPIGGVLFDFPDDPADPWQLLDHGDFDLWIELARRITGTPIDRAEALLMGPEIKQSSIQTAIRRADAD